MNETVFDSLFQFRPVNSHLVGDHSIAGRQWNGGGRCCGI